MAKEHQQRYVRDMLRDAGYDPAEALIKIRKAIQEEIDRIEFEVLGHIDSARPGSTARAMRLDESLEYWQKRAAHIDELLLPYAHPKLTAAKVDATMDAGPTLLDLLTNGRASEDSE